MNPFICRIRAALFGLTALIAASAAAAGSTGEPAPHLATDIPQYQRDLIIEDYTRLSSMRLSIAPSSYRAFFGTSGERGSDLKSWMDERLHYVVSDDLPDDAHDSVEGGEYPTGPVNEIDDSRLDWTLADSCRTVIQDPEQWDRLFTRGANFQLYMNNIGVMQYRFGKSTGRKVSLEVQGFGFIDIPSPRTGIVQIGPALFAHDSRNGDPRADGLMRISVYAHEARHSDGNGKSLGFIHAVCPEGHDYAGIVNCDDTRNGAYALDAVLTQHLAEDCQSDGCQVNVAGREWLRVLYLDSYARVLQGKVTYPDCSSADYVQRGTLREANWLTQFVTPQTPLAEGLEHCDSLVSQLKKIGELKQACTAFKQPTLEADAGPEQRLR